MGEERVEVFRGHTDECIRHLSAMLHALPATGRDAARMKSFIATFCRVTVPTVTQWLTVAESTIIEPQRTSLHCLLDTIGYRVIEFERLPQVLRNFSELIGHGLLSYTDAAVRVGYARPSKLFRAIHSKMGPERERRATMYDLWKERKDMLEEEKARNVRRARAVGFASMASPRSDAPVGRHQPSRLRASQIVAHATALAEELREDLTSMSDEGRTILLDASHTFDELAPRIDALRAWITTTA